MRLLPLALRKAISSALVVTVTATSIPFTATPVYAAPSCADGYAADAGRVAGCSAVRIGGQVVGYPKLQWNRVSDMPMVERLGSARIVGSNQAIELANRSALALGLQAKDVASAVSFFPANVPYIIARYNPLDATLRVDIFKLEKTTVGNNKTAGLYLATFGPAHGDFWKASRAYIHPDSYKAGLTPGVNPFTTYRVSGDDLFHNISLSGAQVVVGHAMRMAGAPAAVLQVASPRFSTEKKSSGNAFRKKTEIIIRGHVKPRWFIAQPTQFMSRSTTMAPVSYCAPDPRRTNCALYETASAGVAFEEFTGGMLQSSENTWVLDTIEQSGWGFLAVLVVAVIGSFALAALGPALLGTAGAGAGAAAGGAAAGTAATSAATGMFGNFLVSQGLVSGFSSLAASIAVEAAYTAASMALLGGANLSSMMTLTPMALLGYSQVIKGTADLGSPDEYQTKLNWRVAPLTNGDFSQGAPVLTSFGQTVYGDCLPDTKLSQCVGATGFVQRVDQYQEQNMVEFMGQFVRDNNGELVRDATPKGLKHKE